MGTGLIQDPAEELTSAVQRSGDRPSEADRRTVELVRRRFGLALPLPFARLPADGEALPIRVAVPADGPAIALVWWRSWRHTYKEVLPESFLADLEMRPSVSDWVSAATVPSSTRYHLLVVGRPGEVFGMAEVRPARDLDLDPSSVSEVTMLYLDPLVLRRGLGSALIEASVASARAEGVERLALWAVVENRSARRFYESLGWQGDGSTHAHHLGNDLAMDATRYLLELTPRN